MATKETVLSAADKIEHAGFRKPVWVGFDGFVDEICELVDKREDHEVFRPMEKMKDFGARIIEAAGLSCNIEVVSRKVKLGGNGPIMANSFARLGCPVHYVGALGYPEIHPVFQEFASACSSTISLANPAETQALEFNDGKIMMGKCTSLNGITWSNLLDHISEDALAGLLSDCELLAYNNWTMLPFLNEVFAGINQILDQLPERKMVFIDLSDPLKRNKKDIAEVLKVLSEMTKRADVIFGMNENESIQIAEILFETRVDNLTTRASRIRRELNLKLVVIHPAKSAAIASVDGEAYLEGPYTPYPKLTTGAGDNFNAGFCFGVLSGLEPDECLAAGVCCSGFYVRNERSATREELIAFMRQWAHTNCGVIP